LGLLRCWPGRLAQARLGLLPFAPDLWKLVQPALAQPGFVLLARLGRVLVWNRTMMIGSKPTIKVRRGDWISSWLQTRTLRGKRHLMSISLAPAGIGVAGQNLISGFPPPCALRLREMYFFVMVPARLDLGLPRRTALQGFARICVHSRAKICFPVFPLRVLCDSVRGCIFSQRRLRAWICGCHGGQPSKDSRGFASIRGPKSAFRFSPSVCFVAP
jgi:hypothetical protein